MGCFSSKEGLSAATVVPQQQETVDKDSASRMASKSPDSAKSSSAVPPSPNRTAVDGAQESGSSMSLLLDLGDHSLHHQEVQSSTGSSRIQRRRSQKFARKVVTTEGDFQDRNGVARRVSELDFDPVFRNECTTEEREKLHRALKKNFLFCNLEQVDCDCMINSMTRVNVAPGEIVFKQGDEGDSCYVILDGAVSVKIGDRVIKELCKGETFGELAMLYKCDRSATIRCLDSGPAVLFKIEGRSMRRYKAIINERNRKKILKFLNDDAVFANCTMSDKEQLANLCYIQEFREGDMFMREGERGECLFLLLSGRAETMDKFGNRKKVKQGAIIGELGFARTAEHAYCACALTKVTLLSFSTEELKRTFGSLQDVLRLSALKSVLSRGLFFNDLTDIQQNALVDCFEEMSCTQGMSIVTRGAHPQLILVMEGNCVMLGPDSLQKDAGIEAEGSCYQSLNRDSLLLTDGMLDNLMAVATARYGPRDMCGQENLMNGEPMPGSLLVISPTARIQRVGLNQLLQACIPEDARVKGQIQNLKDLLRLNKIRSVLSAILVFRTITKEQLDKIAFALKDRLFRANEVIYNQGDEATNEAGLFLISEGSVRIEVDGKVVRTSARWDYFGERALLQHEKRSATCIAGPKGCQCLVLDSQSFLDIVSKFRGVLENRIKLQDTDVKFKDLKPIAIVGRGTFGVVKLVVHREDESRRYALKCIDKKTGVRLKQQSFLAVEREINALCFHPCIMQFIRTFQDSRRIYFLTEFLGGGDLFSAIRQIGMLNRNQIRFFTGSIVLAIEYLHERTIMYRDLKPENVLLDDEGNTKLVDFGCCRQAQRTYTLVGTPEYLAPEVVLARGYTCTADWWSLGVMLYEFCCGPLPFGRDVDDQLELYREILESPLVFPEYVTDNRALDLMSSLLEKNPKRRLGSARGAVEIKAHDYFEGFDWDALASGYMDRPWKPNAEHTKKQWEPLDADEEAYALSEDENFVPEDWCAHF